jgi:pyruvate carboxylase
MLSGGLGWPDGGFAVQRVVLGEKKFKEAQTAFASGTIPDKPAPIHLKKLREELAERLKREISEDDLYSHLIPAGVRGFRAALARVQRCERPPHARLLLRPRIG